MNAVRSASLSTICSDVIAPLKSSYASSESRDQIDFGSVADVRGAKRLNSPNTINPFCNQCSEDRDFVERKFRKLLPENFHGLIVGEGLTAMKARKRIRARHCFEIEDDGVLAQKTSGLRRPIVSHSRYLSSTIGKQTPVIGIQRNAHQWSM